MHLPDRDVTGRVEMDEILYELRSNIVALNCGRWDYIFSYIKTLKRHSDRVLPDRKPSLWIRLS